MHFSYRISPEDQQALDVLFDGYNNWRKQKGWSKISTEDIMQWEGYKRMVLGRIASRVSEKSNGIRK
jgi:hypothetical protein